MVLISVPKLAIEDFFDVSFLFSMSTKDLSYLLDGESSQGRGSEWAGGGSDPPNNYQQDLTLK